MIHERRQRYLSILLDYVMTNIALILFNVVRFHLFVRYEGFDAIRFLRLEPVVLGQVFLPLMMVIIYFLSGYYYSPVFRSRLDELLKSLITTFIGAVLIYFIVLINDPIDDRGDIYELVGILWGLMFICVYPIRLAVTVCLLRRARNSRSGYPTFVVGASQMALSLIERINNRPGRRSFNIVGIVDTSDYQRNLNTDLPIYHIDQLEAAVKENGICRLIVIPHHNGKRATLDLVSSLFPTGLQIYVSPTLYYSILGRMPVDDIVGEPLVNISRPFISPMTASFKRFFDVAFSVIAILLLIPIYLAIAIAIKCDSKGPIIYSQERVGYKKRPFKILKFRTMRCDAEENGPSLSSPNDPRVTRVGRFLRKYRLDELPQFVNVLRGDMAIVGPRPEREYYVKQIVSRAPYYSLVHQLRPGITSLGMVKYGYAVDVDQMLDRLKYDLIYLENVSLRVDFKIIYYTISTVLTGRGV